MPLDWLNTPLDADIGDLIARKKRAKTIELLRSQLQGRMVPPVQMRLQLADLLVQAGREAEAIPVLIGLADEFAGDGFVAKAIAILKRVDRVQPGRAEVEERLERLVKLQRAAPASRPAARSVPEFGIEEIRDEPIAEAVATDEATVPDEPVAPVSTEAPPPASAAAEPPPPPPDTETSERVRGVFRRFLASLPGGAHAGDPVADTPAALSPERTAADDDVTVPDPAPIEAAPPAPAPETVAPAEATAPEAAAADEPAAGDGDDPGTARYKPVPPEAWSTFQPETTVPDSAASTAQAAEASIPSPEPAAPVAAASPVDPGAPVAAPPPSEPAAAAPPLPSASEPAPAGHGQAQGVAGRIRGAFRWLVASLAPPAAEPKATASGEPTAPAMSAPGASPSEAAAPAPAMAEEAAEDEEPMSDEDFQERLLDLVQDILRRPGARKQARESPPLDRRLVLRYAQRLLATALFGALSEEELLAVVRGLRLHLHGPGDILVTEGERGQSVFVLAAGTARVFVRSPSGRNFPVAALRDGDFFGEISSLSGRPRTATVTASARCELLELDRPTLDEIARTHPRVAEVLEDFYIRRASSPEAAAVRAVPVNDPAAERKAIEVLEAHFGQSRWDPRMRLRLADVLLKAGKYEDAVPVLVGLADDLARAGFPEKAIAVLKKIEKIQHRDEEVVNLAPLARAAPSPAAAAGSPGPGPDEPARPAPLRKATAEFFEGWLLDVLRDRVEAREGDAGREAERAALASLRGYGPGLLASPLFEDFTDDELLAVIRSLRLLTFEPGDIIITEGEPGQSLFVLTTGTVKVFVRDPSGRNVALCPLGEGAFFGEIATLSGRPRSATVTAASRCELLELDKPSLEAIVKAHPRVREVLEEHYIARAADPEAAAIRGTGPAEAAGGEPA